MSGFSGRKDLLDEDDPCHFSTDGLNLRSPDGHTQILSDLRAMKAKSGHDVKLIVIDTLAVATSGGNECTSEDMGAALFQVNEVVKASEVTVLLLHHPGKDVSRGREDGPESSAIWIPSSRPSATPKACD